MMKPYTILTAMALAGAVNAQTTHELMQEGFSFFPAVLTIQAGDSVHVVTASPHTCTEVSQATWNANGNTSNGGFNFPPGSHTFMLDVVGTNYYVCIPHASMGMKGQIIVEDNSIGVQENTANTALQLFPNPASTSIHIAGVASGQRIQVREVTGKVALEVLLAEDGMLDVSALRTGSYSIAVRDAQGNLVATERLTIAR